MNTTPEYEKSKPSLPDSNKTMKNSGELYEVIDFNRLSVRLCSSHDCRWHLFRIMLSSII